MHVALEHIAELKMSVVLSDVDERLAEVDACNARLEEFGRTEDSEGAATVEGTLGRAAASGRRPDE